jgi:hypothetical protein
MAHQGDLPDLQTLSIQQGKESKRMVRKAVIDTARAVLLGWFSTAEHKEVAEQSGMSDCKLIAFPHVFVTRATSHGWTQWSVQFTSDAMLEAVIEEIGGGESLSNIPSGWPDFMYTE